MKVKGKTQVWPAAGPLETTQLLDGATVVVVVVVVDVVVVVEDDTVLVDFSEAEEFVFEFGGMVTEVGNVGRGYTRLSAVTSIISSV